MRRSSGLAALAVVLVLVLALAGTIRAHLRSHPDRHSDQRAVTMGIGLDVNAGTYSRGRQSVTFFLNNDGAHPAQVLDIDVPGVRTTRARTIDEAVHEATTDGALMKPIRGVTLAGGEHRVVELELAPDRCMTFARVHLRVDLEGEVVHRSLAVPRPVEIGCR
jgi:hypothetical protein